MVSKDHYFIKKADRDKAENELLSVSGSFGLSGIETENGDLIVGLPQNHPKLKLFDKTIRKYATRHESKTADDVLKTKKKKRKVLDKSSMM